MRFPFPLAFLGEYNQSLDIVTANPLWKKTTTTHHSASRSAVVVLLNLAM